MPSQDRSCASNRHHPLRRSGLFPSFLILLLLVATLPACTSQEVGRSVYRAFEQKKCQEENGSIESCNHAISARP
ncbi:hypothetical protein SIID45300_01409 [Candidatus Magnetaquicoccaceae bacterium FCR-1]|uniref:Secreted protein n=1 Tax=Candidatus Magnetaquiglobus chichijimensis TaxID=3141448 RepID=A0ABQ0C871_9PROT